MGNLEEAVYGDLSDGYIQALARGMHATKEQLLGRIFDEEYGKWALNKLHLVYIRRGRYEIWKKGKRVAKKIKHRREALALMKLLIQEN